LKKFIGRNKIDDIVEILKFAQKTSLSFESIFPHGIELPAETCVKLMEAFNKEADDALKNFSLNGIKPVLIPKIKLANDGDPATINEILDFVKDRNLKAYDQLCSEISEFGAAVKTYEKKNRQMHRQRNKHFPSKRVILRFGKIGNHQPGHPKYKKKIWILVE
jgi:hypothetical protein